MNHTKSFLISASLLSILAVFFSEVALAMDDKGKEEATSPPRRPKKKAEQRQNEQDSKLPKIKVYKGGVKISYAPWAQIQKVLEPLIEETLRDSNNEEHTFCFDVTRDDWNNYKAWEKTLKAKGKYPVSFGFSNKGAEGDRVEGVYALYHKEIHITNRTKKLDEAKNIFVYEGKLDESRMDTRMLYELILNTDITVDDFEQGKYGYQDKILVKPVKLKGADSSVCYKEVEDTIETTLKRADQAFVTFVFELPEKATFGVHEIKPHRFRPYHIPTIIDEQSRRLYMCFINDQKQRLDLHNRSLAEALEETEYFIQERFDNYEEFCTIITGRGNHENANGSRGVIFSAFPGWMKRRGIKPLVERWVQRDGAYTVFLKKPALCDVRELVPGQDPYDLVFATIQKVLETDDLRVQIKFDDPNFYSGFYKHLIFRAGRLAMAMSPYSMEQLSGELRLNLRNEDGLSVHSFGYSAREEEKAPIKKPNVQPSQKKPVPAKNQGTKQPQHNKAPAKQAPKPANPQAQQKGKQPGKPAEPQGNQQKGKAPQAKQPQANKPARPPQAKQPQGNKPANPPQAKQPQPKKQANGAPKKGDSKAPAKQNGKK